MFKRPESVLVVIHTPDLHVLLLRRTRPVGFWQSVTGSLEAGETPLDAAAREVLEETGIAFAPHQMIDWQRRNRFRIRDEWRARYAEGVSHNVEHVFSVSVAAGHPVRLAPQEHDAMCWLPHEEAARRVFSWTNRDAILALPRRLRDA